MGKAVKSPINIEQHANYLSKYQLFVQISTIILYFVTKLWAPYHALTFYLSTATYLLESLQRGTQGNLSYPDPNQPDSQFNSAIKEPLKWLLY